MTSKKVRVLVGSPIYQKPHILQKFLLSLKRLDAEGKELAYFFIHDNEDERSSRCSKISVRSRTMSNYWHPIQAIFMCV
ncbi:hypothetical protein ABGT24_15895 [Peribacillus frigoritolerans]|uniref:hypothetical protein n=1 Tax=Peribacillus frigoritolerans TaxID=450367 RepID=UPI00345CC05F